MDALLLKAKTIQKEVENYEDNDIPAEIRSAKTLHPYYRLLKQNLKGEATQEQMVEISRKIVEIIQEERIVDWKKNIEVQRTVTDRLEDFFFDTVRTDMGLNISIEFIESFIKSTWNLATKND